MTQWPVRFPDISLTALPLAEQERFFSALADEPVRGLRLRPGVSRADVLSVLPDDASPIPWAKNAYYVALDSMAGSHVLHAAGAYYLQEPSAMAAVGALDIQPGQRVLDLCAAPGGKSTQIAACMEGMGTLVANEPIQGRARILSQNIERMGVCNAIVTNEPPKRLASRWSAWFDRVLVDAPCSGEGMFRREPNVRDEWTPQAPAGCASRQGTILDEAAMLLRPGGVLVYSTCTFNETENEGVVSKFLEKHADFVVENFALDGVGVSQNGCLRLWPHRVRGEGHFVARMRRRGECPPLERQKKRLFSLPDIGHFEMAGELVEVKGMQWIMPTDILPLDGIRVLRTGLAVGERRKQVFVPNHALAMAFSPEAFDRQVLVDEAQAAQYLRGETLDAPEKPKGWTVVVYHGLSLGWGKCVEGVVKNHLPKGLRMLNR